MATRMSKTPLDEISKKPKAGPSTVREKLPDPAEILKAFGLLFGGKHSGLTTKSRLRFVKVEAKFLLLEQNPDKQSAWAKMARQGHKVAWLMPNYKGLVVDGAVKFLKN
jgi:hypothetical protein